MDNEVKKYALVINNSDRTSAEQAAQNLQEQGYEVALVSTKISLDRTIQKISRRMDDNDQFILYATGSNEKEGFALPNYTFSNLAEKLNALHYGRRVIAMEQPSSAHQFYRFANEHTALLAGDISPNFFAHNSEIDANGDGLLTFQERVTFDSPNSLYFNPMPEFALDGRVTDKNHQPFKPEVIEVSTLADLQAQLKQLKGGRALVTFSADWCGPCQEYKPTFQALAEEFGGRFLMIHFEGIDGSEEACKKEYGFEGLPTVLFLDANGRQFPIASRDRPLEGLLPLPLTHFEYLTIVAGITTGPVKERLENLTNFPPELLRSTTLGVYRPQFIEKLKEIFSNEENRYLKYAALCLFIRLKGSQDVSATQQFLKIFDENWDIFPPKLKIALATSAQFLGESYLRTNKSSENQYLISQLTKKIPKEDNLSEEEQAFKTALGQTIANLKLTISSLSSNIAGQIIVRYQGKPEEIAVVSLCNESTCLKIDSENFNVNDGRLTITQKIDEPDQYNFVKITLNDGSTIEIVLK